MANLKLKPSLFTPRPTPYYEADDVLESILRHNRSLYVKETKLEESIVHML